MLAREAIPRGTRWVFTLNNYTDDEVQGIKNWFDEQEMVEEGIVGYEVGENGTPHLQGLVKFCMRRSRVQVMRIIGPRCWCQLMQGTWKQAWTYCAKGGNIAMQKGELQVRQGDHRKGDKKARALEILADCGELELDAFIQKWPDEWLYRRGAIEKAIMEARVLKAEVFSGELRYKNFWMWGPAGIGKSRWATGQDLLWRTFRKGFNKWWCGFKPGVHRTVVIDDWPLQNGEMLSYHLKIWGDRYPFVAEVKNGGITLAPGEFRIIVTSNYSPEDVFRNPNDLGPILRRFQVIEWTTQNQALLGATLIGYSVELMPPMEVLEEEPINEQLEEIEEGPPEEDE
jgi:hypothetical protein